MPYMLESMFDSIKRRLLLTFLLRVSVCHNLCLIHLSLVKFLFRNRFSTPLCMHSCNLMKTYKRFVLLYLKTFTLMSVLLVICYLLFISFLVSFVCIIVHIIITNKYLRQVKSFRISCSNINNVF